MGGRGKDLVAFVAVVLAAMWGTWLFVRTQLDLGSEWTDGAQHYERLAGDRIRYAVWDAPEPLPGLGGGGSESRPALSPDGRYLVFSGGERGLNTDLYVAELVGGEAVDPRPLVSVNSAFDDLAPAFGPDALYFASDRAGAGYGLDLWRVSYADGVFGPAEPIGAGVNTTADETDPYPVPGTPDLVFSSNRPQGARTDHELYRARFDHAREDPPGEPPVEASEVEPEAAPKRAFVVEALFPLNTPFDERDPALTSDGRTVIFASDRDGSLGSFDLYRSFLEGGEWLPPEPLVGVNTESSERGPLLSADGFSLYLGVTPAGAPSDLWRARSLELFRVPGPPLSLQEVLLLVSLLVLALLAALAKRWHAIDVLYKCFLISFLVHMILMWYLREVYPEAGPVEMRGDDSVFRVRLAPAPTGTPSADRERDGELQLEARRIESSEAAPSKATADAQMAAAAPARASLATPERALEAPQRSDAQLAETRRSEVAEPTLQDREAPSERRVQNAPGLALVVREAAAAPTSSESSTPNRASTTARTRAATPSAARIEVAAEARDAGRTNPAPERLTAAETPRTVRDATAIVQPNESFEATRAEAPAMRLPEVATAVAPRRSAGSAARRASEQRAAEVELGAAEPIMADLSELTPESRLDATPLAPRVATLAPTVARGDPDVDLRQVHESPSADVDARESQRFDATSELAQSQATRRTTASSDPRRVAVAPAPTFVRRDTAPETRDLAGLAPVRSPRVEAAAPRGRAEREATRPSPTSLTMREVHEAPAETGSAAIEPPRFDATADLATATPMRKRRVPSEAPQLRHFTTTSEADAPSPSFTPLATVAPPEPTGPVDDGPRRMEHTPYKNRFGEEKLRALEEFGGGAETERAVAAGLDYLAEIQASRGHWGERRDFHDKYGDVRVGKTGLSLLAFLGAGHTPISGTKHAQVADRAVRYLLATQDRATGHFGNSSAYGHGIATYALAECYALTREERLEAPLERAIAHILVNQNDRSDARFSGGWGYYYADGRVWNNDPWPRVSVTAWQVMALESARLGGIEVPDATFERAREFIVNAWDPGRRAFRYNHDPSRLNSGYPILPASTPAGLFALSLLGIDVSSPELQEARRFVLRRAPRDYRYTSDDDFVRDARGNLYFWYYGSLAMFRVGGNEWERWNTAMKSTLLDAQDGDGSWRPISIYSAYAGDDDAERSYSTAVCVLTLEVYYRYFTPLLEVR